MTTLNTTTYREKSEIKSVVQKNTNELKQHPY